MVKTKSLGPPKPLPVVVASQARTNRFKRVLELRRLRSGRFSFPRLANLPKRLRNSRQFTLRNNSSALQRWHSRNQTPISSDNPEQSRHDISCERTDIAVSQCSPDNPPLLNHIDREFFLYYPRDTFFSCLHVQIAISVISICLCYFMSLLQFILHLPVHHEFRMILFPWTVLMKV